MQGEDLGDARDARRGELPEQPMTARRGRARDGSRHRADRPPDLRGMPGRVERPRAMPRLDDDRRGRDRGDEPIALQEAVASRRGATRHLGEQQAARGDAAKQRLVPRRVESVETTRQHGDRRATCGQRPAMRSAVDAVGPAGDHDDAAVGESGRELRRDMLAVAGRGPRTDDRHRFGGRCRAIPFTVRCP